MRYATGQEIAIGDKVVADGMDGIVVCDFDHRKFAEGYEGWAILAIETLGGDAISSGIMIETGEAGMIHYVQGIGDIEYIQP